MSADTRSPVTAKALNSPDGAQGCPTPASLLQMQCELLHSKKSSGTEFSPRSNAVKAASAISTSLGPADLQAAYGLGGTKGPSATGGAGETVAIVDAFGDTHIQSDLAQYRSNWSLPACDSSTGAGCLSVFNEHGQTTGLPGNPTGENTTWMDETSLDVDMVSAICPNCHIDLFQASSTEISDLGTADNSAAKVSKFVSNSWSGGDFPGENVYDNTYFNHPGVAMVFASGDDSFGATWPSSSGLVTSVGGTYLENSSDGVDYTQVVWDGQSTGPGTGTAAGCSSGEGKPSWQTDPGCTNRTQNDVSAVADAPFGIDEYTSSGDCGPADGDQGAFDQSGDCAAYGTSVATPIITAIYALANPNGPTANTYPVSYLYQHAGSSDFTPVTSGQVGTCESSRLYLCNAGHSLSNGYNGPDGLGTPGTVANGGTVTTPGTAAFQNTATGNIVSIENPGTYDLTAGTHVTLPAVKAYDSGSSTLTYSQTGLPSGVSINSASGVISGTLPANAVNDKITVTVKDATGASAAIHFGFVGVKAMNGSYHAGSGEVKLDIDGKCMNDAHNDTHVDAPISIYPCAVSSSQDWSYSMPAGPGQSGRITIHGKCLYVLGTTDHGFHLIGLANCANSSALLWQLTGDAGEIVNPATGDCLTDPDSTTKNNSQLTVQPCTGDANQAWVMPGSPITSGIAGKCLAVSGGSAISTACSTSSSQQVTLGFDGSLEFGKYCIYNAGSSPNDGTAIKELPCNYDNFSEEWGISAYGQIENLTTEKCLANPTNSVTNGTKLELEDCYGQQGELWAVS
jgi:hypothetical protein